MTTLSCKNNKLKYKIFYVNVTYKPKTQGWAIYISYKHEIVYIVIWHVTEIKILLTYYKRENMGVPQPVVLVGQKIAKFQCYYNVLISNNLRPNYFRLITKCIFPIKNI